MGGQEKKLICCYAMNLRSVILNTSHITLCACVHLDPVSVIFRWRFRRIAIIDSSFRHVRLPTWNNSAPSRRTFTKFGISGFLEDLLKDFDFD